MRITKETHQGHVEEEDADLLFARNCNHVALLKSCAKKKDLSTGSKIHTVLHHKGLIKKNIIIGCSLLNMYAKCGSLAMALEVFHDLPARDVVSWTSLIDTYAQHRHGVEALDCLEQMQAEGFCPNAITFLCAVKACSSIGATKVGDKIYAKVVSQGLLREKPELGNALVDMYVKCGTLVKAQRVFDELPVRNVVSYNTLIAGYAQHGRNQEALACFERMHGEGLSHNAVTFLSTLKACCSLETAEKGKELHAELARRGMLGNNLDIGNTLVDMYVKSGTFAMARQVFDEILVRNVVSWNVLISGYAQHGLGEEALNCLEQMHGEGLYPDAVTFLCVLKACGSIGAAKKGEEMHAEIVRQRMLESNCVLGNALVDMYAKCGVLRKAQQVFDELCVRDVVSWTALMEGFVQAGKHNFVFSLFSRMIKEGIKPNLVTFVVVLNACSHLGGVDEGQLYFETMSTNFGIIPTLEHHSCMVDLFSRVGQFDNAMAVIKKMPSSDYLPTWYTLLGACKQWGNVNLGRAVFEHAVRLDKKTSLAYVYMSDMYAAIDMQEEVDNIDAMKAKSEPWTNLGPSLWIDASENTSSFCIQNKVFLENKASNVNVWNFCT